MSVSIWITIVFLKNLRRPDDIISGYWYWKIFRIFVSQVRIWQKALWLYTNSIHINNKNIQAWHRWFRTTSARLENTVTLYMIDVFIQILEEKYILNFTMFLVSDMAAFGFWRATAFKVIFRTSVIPSGQMRPSIRLYDMYIRGSKYRTLFKKTSNGSTFIFWSFLALKVIKKTGMRLKKNKANPMTHFDDSKTYYIAKWLMLAPLLSTVDNGIELQIPSSPAPGNLYSVQISI